MRQNSKQLTGLFAATLAAAVLAACESERSVNPLSPSIAGPMAGVEISAPGTVGPASGELIRVGNQPITLRFQPAASNSVRPFWYELDISTTGDFAEIVFKAERIEVPADGAQVEFSLPATLSPEQVYFWRVRAIDGANAGPYSDASMFEVITPVALDAPAPLSPAGGSTLDSLEVTLLTGNATLSGPATSGVTYRFELALDAAFTSLVAVMTTAQGDGSTSASYGPLDWDRQYFWRVQARTDAREGIIQSPWSGVQTFQSPAEPVSLGVPVPVSPIHGITTPTTQPTFVVNNGSVSGPAGSITYEIQIATDETFNQIVSTLTTTPSGGATTSVVSDPLTEDQAYYWRARATDGTVTTEWSAAPMFRTPAPPDEGGGGEEEEEEEEEEEGGGEGDELDLSQVTWLHASPRSWPVTSTITRVSLGNPPTCIYHTKSGKWPVVNGIEGNPWVFANINGQWYGATYEWLRPGQTCKLIDAGNIGPHTKKSPLETWRPRPGETVGLMVSTPARMGVQGPKQERTNVVLVKWP